MKITSTFLYRKSLLWVPVFIAFLFLVVSISFAGQLGVDVIGPELDTWTALYSHGNTYTASTGFVGQSVSCYLRSVSGGNGRAAVYSTSSGVPSTLLSDSNLVPLTVDGWYLFTLSSSVNIVPGQTYFICIAVDINHGCNLNPGIATNTYYQILGAGLPYPGTYGPTQFNQNALSLYLSGPDHTPTSTSTPVFTPTYTATRTATRTITPSATRTHSPTRTATPTITLSATPTPTFTHSPTYTQSPTLTTTQTVTLTITTTSTLTPTQTATLVPYQPGKKAYLTYPSPAKGADLYFYFYTEGSAKTKIDIWNILGERVDRVETAFAEGGYQRVLWPLKGVASGIYLYQIIVEDTEGPRQSPIKKFVVVK